MELLVFLIGCCWMVLADMRGFTGNKRWPSTKDVVRFPREGS
jgi:hypothetical protein